MIKQYYKTVFIATETLQNGKERRISKAVYAETRKNGKNNGIDQRIEAGKKALSERHYYNIEYLGTGTETFIFED